MEKVQAVPGRESRTRRSCSRRPKRRPDRLSQNCIPILLLVSQFRTFPYIEKKENSSSPPKLLHRNILLPFIGLPSPEEEDDTIPKKAKPFDNREAVIADDHAEDWYS